MVMWRPVIHISICNAFVDIFQQLVLLLGLEIKIDFDLNNKLWELILTVASGARNVISTGSELGSGRYVIIFTSWFDS
jgi:hypothetical protein